MKQFTLEGVRRNPDPHAHGGEVRERPHVFPDALQEVRVTKEQITARVAGAETIEDIRAVLPDLEQGYEMLAELDYVFKEVSPQQFHRRMLHGVTEAYGIRKKVNEFLAQKPEYKAYTEERIASATSIDDLEKILAVLPGIKGGSEFYDGERLAKVVKEVAENIRWKAVEQGPALVVADWLKGLRGVQVAYEGVVPTRACGLQERFATLLEAELVSTATPKVIEGREMVPLKEAMRQATTFEALYALFKNNAGRVEYLEEDGKPINAEEALTQIRYVVETSLLGYGVGQAPVLVLDALPKVPGLRERVAELLQSYPEVVRQNIGVCSDVAVLSTYLKTLPVMQTSEGVFNGSEVADVLRQLMAAEVAYEHEAVPLPREAYLNPVWREVESKIPTSFGLRDRVRAVVGV